MIYKHLKEVSNDFEAFFFDAWGVFSIGDKISESVIAVMAEFVAEGKPVSILSNTPQPVGNVIKEYEKQGMIRGVHYHHIFSAGQLCADAARRGELPVNGKKFYVAWDTEGGDFKAYDDLFDGLDYRQVSSITDADFVYCGCPVYDGCLITDERCMEPELGKVIAAGLPIVCANPDLLFFYNGMFFIANGLPCKIFERCGLEVIYYGKPYPEIYASALAASGNPYPARTLMIGDTLRTDILGATRAGIRTCLTLTHGISTNDLMSDGIALTEANIITTAEKIGASVDYIIEKVSCGDL